MKKIEIVKEIQSYRKLPDYLLGVLRYKPFTPNINSAICFILNNNDPAPSYVFPGTCGSIVVVWKIGLIEIAKCFGSLHDILVCFTDFKEPCEDPIKRNRAFTYKKTIKKIIKDKKVMNDVQKQLSLIVASNPSFGWDCGLKVYSDSDSLLGGIVVEGTLPALSLCNMKMSVYDKSKKEIEIIKGWDLYLCDPKRDMFYIDIHDPATQGVLLNKCIELYGGIENLFEEDLIETEVMNGRMVFAEALCYLLLKKFEKQTKEVDCYSDWLKKLLV